MKGDGGHYGGSSALLYSSHWLELEQVTLFSSEVDKNMFSSSTDDMSMEELMSLLDEVELTAPVVETTYNKITDEDGESLLRDCQ